MATGESADTRPKAPVPQLASGASPQQKGRRPAMRWIVHGLMFTALRHARPFFVAAAIVAQAAMLGSYALLYRRALASLGARLTFRLAARVTLATFLVSHVTPFGSATGALLNVSKLETERIAASTTGEAIGLTKPRVDGRADRIVRGRARGDRRAARLRGLSHDRGHCTGLDRVRTGRRAHGRSPPRHRRADWAPGCRIGAARLASTDPEKVARTSKRLASLTRSALTGRALLESFGFASADLLLDLLSLELMFLAFRHQPGFGPLAVAYAAANIASAIPSRPAGWE
jgi:uncharacterized membrane protein YbhN (UPF0104 family)